MARTDEGLRSEMLRGALDDALTTSSRDRLEALLARHGGLPSARANHKLAAAFANEVASRGARVLPLVLSLARHPARDDEPTAFLPIAAAFALVALANRADREPAGLDEALAALTGHDSAAVRIGASAALAGHAPDALVARAGRWLDADDHEARFATTAATLDALADPNVLAGLRDATALLAYLDRVLDALASASRAAERSPARRRALAALGPALARVVQSVRGGGEWLHEHAARAEHPDLRDALGRALDRLRKSSVGKAEIASIHAALDASAPPLRDPTRDNREARGRGRRAKRRGG
ncbi:MAG: hypothetical protein IT378_16850 [Sandaracinaceae bacterium]|nr:hypothetical protein [Sandaracinaceae bacterium]